MKCQLTNMKNELVLFPNFDLMDGIIVIVCIDKYFIGGIMETFIAILSGIGLLSGMVGLLSVINTAFDLHLRFKGTDLPNDYIAALAILVFGLITGGIGYLLKRRREGKAAAGGQE